MTYLKEQIKRINYYGQLNDLTTAMLRQVGLHVPIYPEISSQDIRQWYTQASLLIPGFRLLLQKQVHGSLPSISAHLLQSGTRELNQHFVTARETFVQATGRTRGYSTEALEETREAERSKAHIAMLQAGEVATATLVEDYKDMLRKIFLYVSVGAYTYSVAASRAAAELADKGITGKHVSTSQGDRRESFRQSMELAAEDYVSQGKGQNTIWLSEEFDSTYVEVSAHYGARPTHAVWQGGIYSLSSGDTRYPNLYDVTGYGTVEGLKGANCRHDMWEYIPGYSVRRAPKIDPEENARVFSVQQSVNRYCREERKYADRATVARAQGNDVQAAAYAAKSREKAARAEQLRQTINP